MQMSPVPHKGGAIVSRLPHSVCFNVVVTWMYAWQQMFIHHHRHFDQCKLGVWACESSHDWQCLLYNVCYDVHVFGRLELNKNKAGTTKQCPVIEKGPLAIPPGTTRDAMVFLGPPRGIPRAPQGPAWTVISCILRERNTFWSDTSLPWETRVPRVLFLVT